MMNDVPLADYLFFQSFMGLKICIKETSFSEMTIEYNLSNVEWTEQNAQ